MKLGKENRIGRIAFGGRIRKDGVIFTYPAAEGDPDHPVI